MKDNLTTILEAENCTLYISGTFGVKLIKCRRVTLGEGPYAQYETATGRAAACSFPPRRLQR